MRSIGYFQPAVRQLNRPKAGERKLARYANNFIWLLHLAAERLALSDAAAACPAASAGSAAERAGGSTGLGSLVARHPCRPRPQDPRRFLVTSEILPASGTTVTYAGSGAFGRIGRFRADWWGDQ